MLNPESPSQLELLDTCKAVNGEKGTTSFKLHLGNCLNILKGMASDSIDSIVTDPPYGLRFMGKRWDYDVPSVEIWAECLRVLKPGGHLLAFAGTRTQHRMAVRIEDAGFEIRDMIAWVYGSGFPKSMDVSKAIDKAAGAERVVIGTAADFARDGSARKADGSHVGPHESQGGHGYGDRWSAPVTVPATATARQWNGWGTALKPALEPITIARKPLTGTVAANVLEYGTGALNIDACRVASNDQNPSIARRQGAINHLNSRSTAEAQADGKMESRQTPEAYRADRPGEALGRWPGNLIHDGSSEVLTLFPHSTSGAMKAGTKRSAQDEPGSVCYGTYGGNTTKTPIKASSGSVARFFYCAKASRKDRNEGLPSSDQKAVSNNSTMRQVEDADWSARNGNHHPTVKPTDLMAYLCRLVTPIGGVVLDPFMGSGSTGKAAIREGFHFIGCERDPEYLPIARARIEYEHNRKAVAR